MSKSAFAGFFCTAKDKARMERTAGEMQISLSELERRGIGLMLALYEAGITPDELMIEKIERLLRRKRGAAAATKRGENDATY